MSNEGRDSDLAALEPLLHRLPVGADRALIESVLEPDFFEVGMSGSVYQRSFVLDEVERRYTEGVDPDDDAWSIEEFSASSVAMNLYLVTYRLSFAGRLSRRCTLWRRYESGWRAVYHQGTTIPAN